MLRRSYTRAMIRLCRDTAGPCLAPGGSVVCVGAFDGVHLGHRALLARVRARAVEQGRVPIAISFEPIPREFFARGGPVSRLTSAREKFALIAAGGVEALLMLRFDAALAAMQPETFVERVLLERCAAREVWVGADFRFGQARRGDVALLGALGARLGFTVFCGKAEDWPYSGTFAVPRPLRDQLGDAAVCLIQTQETGMGVRWFVAQPGDVGDDYFFAVAADGRSVLEGTRLFYR
jgi:hypothetical protein